MTGSPEGPTRALLARLCAFCFPGGEEAARLVRAVRTTQRGEIRMSAEARWMAFQAEEVIEATRSGFRWEARFGGRRISPLAVTDAYENGQGSLVMRLGGVVPVKKSTGLDLDKGELQRYLASLAVCPAAVLRNASLEWKAAGPLVLQVRDRTDPTGASVDLHISDDGCPLGCRAERPRMAGNRTVLTRWSGAYSDFEEREGLRVPTRLEVFWHPPEGPFTYFRSELTSFTALR